ncbi:hypothetical protein AQ915_20640 [Burkholderia pseudomallei]|uniref:hypothetical protein n=1 Tax=Burkholderia pseudomallei TaxID=28450 RepID=UPI00097678F8|nr:hypothetical protein [Burkholderia pseudomallei]ONC30064.1 hypothetical protein AQ915_20640 [Burkholderia pseudomallei]
MEQLDRFGGEVQPLSADDLVKMSKELRKEPEMFRESLATVPVIEHEGRPFAVRLADIPEPHRTAFDRALTGSACPVIEGEGDLAYAWDFTDWMRGTPRWL